MLICLLVVDSMKVCYEPTLVSDVDNKPLVLRTTLLLLSLPVGGFFY